MNTPIALSVNEIIIIFIAMCAGIVTISKAVKVFGSIFLKIKSPTDRLTTMVNELETKVNKLETKVEQITSSTDRRLKNVESGNSVTQEAILALLSHAINNNNIEGLKTAKHKLELYLIERGKEEV